MNIKLIALDMDGTTLKSDNTISPKTVRALRAAQARGILIVPATGRMKKLIPQPILDVGSIRYVITSNGASVMDLEDDSILYTNLMTEKETNDLLEFFMSRDIFTEAYSSGDSYVDERHRHLIMALKGYPESFRHLIIKAQTFVEDMPQYFKQNHMRLEKVNVPPYMPPEAQAELRRELEKYKNLAITSSFSYNGLSNIEVNSTSTSKGDALSHLCERLGIKAREVMAFGDQCNDLEMLRFAGCGVAMQNAVEQAKEAADFVTRSNNEDGIAYALEELLGLCAE